MVKITDQYLTYINQMHQLNLDLASEYLLMAAMLIAIKSRMLLPKIEDANESDEETSDPKALLIQKLLEYEKAKLLAEAIDDMPTAERDFWWLNVIIDNTILIQHKIEADELAKAYQHVLSRLKPQQQQIKREILSVREQMTNILRMLQELHQASFCALFNNNNSNNSTNNVELIVVNFIAILELGKEGLVHIKSSDNDIIIKLL